MNKAEEYVRKTSGIKRILADKVYSVYPNYDYVCGVLLHTKTDEDCQRVLNYIEDHPDVHITTLVLLALQIDQERKL